jgi:hypothetical protein
MERTARTMTACRSKRRDPRLPVVIPALGLFLHNCIPDVKVGVSNEKEGELVVPPLLEELLERGQSDRTYALSAISIGEHLQTLE